MKEETIKKIINGEINTIRIMGYTYSIEINKDCREVLLIPPSIKDASVASSHTDNLDYSYTHGGVIFKQAVSLAKDIASFLPEDTTE